MGKDKKRRSWAVLLAAGAVALAAAGVVYAHWTTTLDATIGVQTGAVGAGWWDIDCGESANPVFEVFVGPGGGDTVARPFGVAPGDSAWYDRGSPFTSGLTQYTKWETNKNVAYINTEWSHFEPAAVISYFNAYPSFYDDCEMEFANSGSVPIAVPYLVIEGLEGTELASDIFADDGHVWVEWSGQTPPDDQVDPIAIPPDIRTGSLKFHVEQVAAQDTEYSVVLTVCVHNWNEPTVVEDDICDLYDVVGGDTVSKTTGDHVIVIPDPFL